LWLCRATIDAKLTRLHRHLLLTKFNYDLTTARTQPCRTVPLFVWHVANPLLMSAHQFFRLLPLSPHLPSQQQRTTHCLHHLSLALPIAHTAHRTTSPSSLGLTWEGDGEWGAPSLGTYSPHILCTLHAETATTHVMSPPPPAPCCHPTLLTTMATTPCHVIICHFPSATTPRHIITCHLPSPSITHACTPPLLCSYVVLPCTRLAVVTT